MEGLIARQAEIFDIINKIKINFGKDSDTRKTPEYLENKLASLEKHWAEFSKNNEALDDFKFTAKAEQYFSENIYEKALKMYHDTRHMIISFKTVVNPSTSASGTSKSNQSKFEKETEPSGPLDEYLSLQRTYFRALRRIIKGIDVETLTDKWDLEDELRNLQSHWDDINKLHIKIDNILRGGDMRYEEEFNTYEASYKRTKRAINQKLQASSYTEKSTPSLDIPTFTGSYLQWRTFYDLFTDAIHKSKVLSKAQKMQHLKGKVRGEAERLIQHLSIAAENYDTAWDILTHRYNNRHVLFTQQIETFLNQPNVTEPTSFQLKRLHDVSLETLHAVHNLGIDTTSWDPIIVHLMAKKLDSASYTNFMESRKEPRELASLDEFMGFLENKFIAREPITKDNFGKPKTSNINQFRANNQRGFYQQNRPPLVSNFKPNFQPTNNFKSYSHANYQGNNNYHQRSYQAIATTNKIAKCTLCLKNHDLFHCNQFMNMPVNIKLQTAKRLNLCFNCLFDHHGKVCISPKKCKICNSEHNTLLHEAFGPTQATGEASRSVSQPFSVATGKSAKPYTDNMTLNVNHVASSDEEILLTTILINVRTFDGNFITLRALLDQGSQISLISEAAAQRLGLPKRKYSASISGIGAGPKQSRGIISMECHSIYNDYVFETQALVILKLIKNLPNSSISKQAWPHLSNIKLADPEYNVSRAIDMLLDANVYSNIIMSGLIKGPPQAPIAQQTKLGWILSGSVRKSFSCNVVINDLSEISKFWELEDITTEPLTQSEEDQYCEEFYQDTTKRLSCGKYEVALPMKNNFEEELGESRSRSLAQFRQLEQRLAKHPEFSEKYSEFMNEYLEMGHMRKANTSSNILCYLPHHGVLKMDSTTTKLRVVFNASSTTTSGKSLNDLMLRGPNLQKDIYQLILNWRIHRYVISADIEKMFRMTLIRESDQNLQMIIWRNDQSEPLTEYHLTTVTYGTKAAPYLAMRTLRQVAIDDGHKHPLAVDVLNENFYMDNLYYGNDSLEIVKEVRDQLIAILKGAGLNLREWSSNHPYLLQDLSEEQLNPGARDFKVTEPTKTLGLQWNASSDTFSFKNVCYQEYKGVYTKRRLLSDISKVFDPIGWLAPLTIRAKLLFQKAWETNLSWDEELPLEIQQELIILKDDLGNIEQFSIKRHLGNTINKYQLHCFCDASERVYASAIYIVTQDHKGEYTSRLVTAKTKLAPLNKAVTLPRLELCGALLLTQLLKKVRTSLKDQDMEVFAWTDSMIVLGWLQGDVKRWKPFVANRVEKITSELPSTSWHHVSSEENAADCATRGMTREQLINHTIWWEGPKWLKTFSTDKLTKTRFETPTLEAKNINVHAALYDNQPSVINDLLINNSSISRVVKTIAWISRFIARTRCTSRGAHLCTLSAIEINNAYNIIIRQVQANDFELDIMHLKERGKVTLHSKLSSLNPYLDKCGLLRVGGRLNNAFIKQRSRNPIILSNSSRFTELIIDQAHKATLHGGPKLTLAQVRDKYWILSGINTVKRQIRNCVTCRRLSYQNLQQIMADLPEPRVTPSRPFSRCAVDFTGHVEIKINKGRGIRTTKGYIAVFVCMSSKAVHLELVSDLSTPAFLAAFRRLCARRGTPAEMYSDNATNFIGASKLLREDYIIAKEAINTDFINHVGEFGVTWHFNAPGWPSAGGLWESAVRCMKHHLKRVIGHQKLTYEEFYTLLTQIEACMNSRPLCVLTENVDDLEALTPGHFLIGGPILSSPQADEQNISLPIRWQYVQTMMKGFWKKWSQEYLQSLQQRSKWRGHRQDIKVGDVVIVKNELLPPSRWAMARVIEVHPGKDGHVRVVSIKTASGITKRPIVKLCLLPVNGPEQNQSPPPSSESPPENIKRSRTKIKRTYYNYFTTFLFTLLSMFMLTVQQDTHSAFYNVSTFQNNQQGLFFDKITDLQIIRDEWKLIMYYNITTYWQGISDIKYYVQHLKDASKNYNEYSNMISQLEHEINEIEHYTNVIMKQSPKRTKRGLINGVGYLANSLFGVLDERFAEQYEKDINKIALNENHLQSLLKNQTMIIDTEYEILKRNEDNMNKQFKLIKERLVNISRELHEVTFSNQNGLYITSSAFTASMIISNLRRIQESLIDTITDISYGHINMNLLSPERLESQIDLISHYIVHTDLTVPVNKDNILDLYQLIKVCGRVRNNYLIIEVRIPLVSRDIYELNKVISIPQKLNTQSSSQNIPKLPFIAYNFRKDLGILLNDNDIRSCFHTVYKVLCPLNNIIYDFSLKRSYCEINTSSDVIDRTCESVQSRCRDQWIRLHRPNTWLYSCCEECTVRILCASTEVSMVTLTDNGLITIGPGCTLKSGTLNINAHNNFANQITITETIDSPEISTLNRLLNTSTFTDPIAPQPNHKHQYDEIRGQLDLLKEQSQQSMVTIHDVHHYTMLYVIVGVLVAAGGVFAYTRMRSLRRQPRAAPPAPPRPTDSDISAVNVPRSSLNSVDKGTSPMVSVRFKVRDEFDNNEQPLA